MSCGGTRLGLSIGACGGLAGGLAHLGNFGVLAYDFSSLGVYAYCLGLERWVLGFGSLVGSFFGFSHSGKGVRVQSLEASM